jgi:hypothetical protein
LGLLRWRGRRERVRWDESSLSPQYMQRRHREQPRSKRMDRAEQSKAEQREAAPVDQNENGSATEDRHRTRVVQVDSLGPPELRAQAPRPRQILDACMTPL